MDMVKSTVTAKAMVMVMGMVTDMNQQKKEKQSNIMFTITR